MFARTRRSADGLSLVELLAVLVIIAVMAAVTAPAFMRMFSSDKTGRAALELYAMLRAAKIYASANGLEAGIAYMTVPGLAGPEIPTIDDEVFATRRRYLDKFFLVRALTDPEKASVSSELSSYGLRPEDIAKLWYVPVMSRQGEVTAMQDGTCVFLDVPGLYDEHAGDSEFGLTRIHVGLLSWEDPETKRGPHILPGIEEYPNLGPGETTPANLFPAHVFKPSGTMRTNSTRQRFTLHVGHWVDADDVDRLRFPELDERRLRDLARQLAIPDLPQDFYSTLASEYLGVDLPPEEARQLLVPLEVMVPLELYAATGRLRTAS
ncbi:MAG TPA: prepilin-type N-terminal cleavage/methylation domain-containing protein [Candidatus Hydrogenedentes bacterium]|nr:prepilin-type N-terminal cleavage/methylation domain-containing protein [Candidatus Hydrogenedentota bacterium]HPG68684.1 prepilin-type N-terminal cleavage/methylation domain-containing protein [Candidatus Hydrogenedentota bacterium]